MSAATPPVVVDSETPPQEDCGDGVDNDGDGLVDCLDAECPPCQEDCTDGVDNDSDGLVDCEDAECIASCVESECINKVDDDLDGYIDCDDADCWGTDPCKRGVLVQLTAGRINTTAEGHSKNVLNGGYSSFNKSFDHIEEPRGILRIALNGYADTATDWSTCTWEAESFRGSLRLGQHQHRDGSHFEYSTAVGTWQGLEASNCPDLPELTDLMPAALRRGSALWTEGKTGLVGGKKGQVNWVNGNTRRSSWGTASSYDCTTWISYSGSTQTGCDRKATWTWMSSGSVQPGEWFEAGAH